MANIQQILTDPAQGLIPYLDSNLTGTYQRLQVRPWNFDSTATGQSTGFRIRDFRSDSSSNQSEMSRTVALGRAFEMTNNIDASTEAGLFVEKLCGLLHRAAECVMYVDEINQISGSTYPKQSGNDKKWYMIVYVQFELVYYYD